jgi:hypothetical protein
MALSPLYPVPRLHRCVKIDDRLLPAVALVLGIYVLVAEIPSWGARSSLAPVLSALGLGVIALALAHLLRERGS